MKTGQRKKSIATGMMIGGPRRALSDLSGLLREVPKLSSWDSPALNQTLVVSWGNVAGAGGLGRPLIDEDDDDEKSLISGRKCSAGLSSILTTSILTRKIDPEFWVTWGLSITVHSGGTWFIVVCREQVCRCLQMTMKLLAWDTHRWAI